MKHEPDTRYFAVATAIVVVVNVVVAFVPWCGSQVELQQDDSSGTDAKQTTSAPPVSVDQRTKFFRRHVARAIHAWGRWSRVSSIQAQVWTEST